jgi:hypothetical protein
MKRTKKTREFVAQAEDGTTVTIEEFTDFVHAGGMGDPNAEVEGLKSLVTTDGMHVNVLGEGEYEIVESGLKVRRV